MPYERLRTMLGTLRFRLMAWNTAVLVLIGIPTLLMVHIVLRYKLLREFDGLLQDDTEELRLAVRKFPSLDPVCEELERKAEGHIQHGWFVQIFAADGRLLWSSRNSPDLPPVESLSDEAQELRAWPDGTLDDQGAGTYRLVQVRIAEPGRPPLTVRVGASVHTLQDDVTLLTEMLVAAGVIILLLAPLGGYWLAGRATLPLARIIATTALLRPDHLDERLPVRRTGDELDQLSETTNGFLDRIASYLQQKRDFLANAAHELRSPLTAICTSVEVALDHPRTSQEYVSLLGDILEECQHLQVLVNQLLLLAEGETERLALAGAVTRLDRVVGKSVDMFRGVAEAQNVELRVQGLESAEVLGAESHLRQVVNNLLDNAIKFNRPGGRVDVDLRVLAGQVRLQIADTGIGIPADDLPRVFDRFYRVDKTRQREGGPAGNGLGLSICATIVAALQGQIAALNQPEGGSIFTVTLPRHGASAAEDRESTLVNGRVGG